MSAPVILEPDPRATCAAHREMSHTAHAIRRLLTVHGLLWRLLAGGWASGGFGGMEGT